jgi:hypothetical protein
MKWIEPENGGMGDPMNLDRMITLSLIDIGSSVYIKFRHTERDCEYWKYPDEESRDADFNRIRRIALGGEVKPCIS